LGGPWLLTLVVFALVPGLLPPNRCELLDDKELNKGQGNQALGAIHVRNVP